jgi:hypothetical protein
VNAEVMTRKVRCRSKIYCFNFADASNIHVQGVMTSTDLIRHRQILSNLELERERQSKFLKKLLCAAKFPKNTLLEECGDENPIWVIINKKSTTSCCAHTPYYQTYVVFSSRK